ncbi:MAG: A/G-specific adenine glycosylase [Gammaproteobacteria bacterium]
MKRGLAPGRIAAKLLPWFERHGRHDLPWQRNPSPYRVWVSEVMLQQTQVATVIPYFERFLRRFPDPSALAAAPQDEVLRHWAGLGYYARGRNLHRAAREIVARHGGRLPETPEGLLSLPGIGRSTAGAILALAHGRRHPILDGNVKRVLARVFAVRKPPDAAMSLLWSLAENCTPAARVAEYTQAIMDLGATVCTRVRPDCVHCPLRHDCGAFAAGLVDELPARKRRRPRPRRRTHMLFVTQGGRVLLRRRPPRGIWGGMWTPPEFANAASAARWAAVAFGKRAASLRRLPAVTHSFTHFDLDIAPWLLALPGAGKARRRAGERWQALAAPAEVGLPAPVARWVRNGLAAGRVQEPGDGEDGELRAARPRSGGPRSRALSRGTRPAHL